MIFFCKMKQLKVKILECINTVGLEWNMSCDIEVSKVVSAIIFLVNSIVA